MYNLNKKLFVGFLILENFTGGIFVFILKTIDAILIKEVYFVTLFYYFIFKPI